MQMRYEELTIEGRNAVTEALRSGRPVDKLFVLDGCQDGPVRTIIREAKKHDTIINFVSKERLDSMSETGKHQGVIAYAAAYEYAEVQDILDAAGEKGEPPFIFILDGIEDPHNLGAIIRTANLAGAHGVIIPKRRAVGLTATVAKTSAGAINYTPVAKVTNIAQTIEELKKEGMWFVCAAMDGEVMYNLDLKGPIGLVIGAEGEGVSRLVREKCDFTASIPMKGNIDSLNASVAAGVLAYEIVRQRMLYMLFVQGGILTGKLSDEALIQMYRDGSRDSIDELFERYKGCVRRKAHAMYIAGGDEEDLIQEGMIGLYKAVQDYDAGREASFATFASMCINSKIQPQEVSAP